MTSWCPSSPGVNRLRASRSTLEMPYGPSPLNAHVRREAPGRAAVDMGTTLLPRTQSERRSAVRPGCGDESDVDAVEQMRLSVRQRLVAAECSDVRRAGAMLPIDVVECDRERLQPTVQSARSFDVQRRDIGRRRVTDGVTRRDRRRSGRTWSCSRPSFERRDPLLPLLRQRRAPGLAHSGIVLRQVHKEVELVPTEEVDHDRGREALSTMAGRRNPRRHRGSETTANRESPRTESPFVPRPAGEGFRPRSTRLSRRHRRGRRRVKPRRSLRRERSHPKAACSSHPRPARVRSARHDRPRP